HYLARLGRLDEARAQAAAIQDAGTSAGNSSRPVSAELRARAALGDLDRIAELIRAVPLMDRADVDQCQMEDLAPMREVPKYSDLFKMCPRSGVRTEQVH